MKSYFSAIWSSLTPISQPACNDDFTLLIKWAQLHSDSYSTYVYKLLPKPADHNPTHTHANYGSTQWLSAAAINEFKWDDCISSQYCLWLVRPTLLIGALEKATIITPEKLCDYFLLL